MLDSTNSASSSFEIQPLARDLTKKLKRTTPEPWALGEFSDFYLAEHNEQGLPKTVAVKIFRGSHFRTKEYVSSFASNLEQCVNRWITYRHKNIAECYGFALDFPPLPALVMKFYPKGNVVQYVTTSKSSFDERKRLVLDIAQGLEYLHTREKPVTHGDLRAANVLIDEDNRAVLADFELGELIDVRNFTTYKPAGPARWMAPELADDDVNDEDDIPRHTPATDMFAFAMTVIEVFTGDVPFASRRQELAVLRFISEGKRPEIPKNIGNHRWLSDLVQRCWDRDPKVRPTASQAVDILTKNLASQTSSWWSYFYSYIPGVRKYF